MSEIYTETTSPVHLKHGQTTVGKVVGQLTACDQKVTRGVLVRAPGNQDPTPNTDTLYIGNVDVTTANGFPLPPGQSMVIPASDASLLFVVSGSDNQTLAWMIL